MPNPPNPSGGTSSLVRGLMVALGLVAASTSGYLWAYKGGTGGGILLQEGAGRGTPASGELVIYAKTDGTLATKNDVGTETVAAGGVADATYITQTSNGTLSAEQALSALGSGLVKNTTGTGVLSIASFGSDYQAPLNPAAGVAEWIATPSSANLAAAVTDETGSWLLGFGTSPALTTPNIGTPSAGTLTNCTGLPVAGGGTGAATLTGFLYGNGTGAVTASTTPALGVATATSINGLIVTSSTGTLTVPNGVVLTGPAVSGTTMVGLSSRRTTTQLVADATLTNDDTLSITLVAGQAYRFTYQIFATSDAGSGGLQYDFGGGTATFTTFLAEAALFSSTAGVARWLLPTSTTVMTGTQGGTTVSGTVVGLVVCNAGGTFIPRFAQATDTGTGALALAGTYLAVQAIP